MADYEKIVFETEDDNVEFYILAQTTLANHNYILVTEDADNEEEEVYIFEECKDDDDYFYYQEVEDDTLLNSLFSIFEELLSEDEE